MKISARNSIKGKVPSVDEGTVMAKVIVDIGGGNSISSWWPERGMPKEM